MDSSGGYADNPFRAEFHDSVVPYRERQDVAFFVEYLFKFEVEHLLARCNFGIEAVYSDYDKSPYGSKYPGELIFVATA